jgi:NTE family protein
LLLGVGLTLLMSVVAHPAALTAQVHTQERSPRIGLVLSGGAARGAAHIGVLKVLEELEIPIDYIAGTSMGAIVGGLYAMGMSTGEIEAVLASLDWNAVFRERPFHHELSLRRKRDDRDFPMKFEIGFTGGGFRLPRGLVSGQRLQMILRTLTLPAACTTDFDRLPIPFRAVAVDIETGDEVVLDQGDLADAIRASMAVPGAFAPVEIDGRLLVDGGVVNNLPVNVARKMGADVVIAVDVSSPLLGRDALGSAIQISSQALGIVMRRASEEQAAHLGAGEVLITPDLGDIGSSSFARATEAVRLGELAAWERAPALRRLRAPSAPPPVRSTPECSRPEPLRIEFLHIENRSRLATRAIERMLRLRAGDVLDVTELQEDLTRVFGLGGFEEVSFRVVEQGGQRGVVIRAIQRSWGPNAFRFGLHLSDEVGESNRYHLLLSYTRLHLNPWGAEARLALQTGQTDRVAAEVFQPLSPGSRFFVMPLVEYRREVFRRYSPAGAVAPYRAERSKAGAMLGVQFGNWGEIGLGMLHNWTHAGPADRASGSSAVTSRQPVLAADATIDRLDEVGFPSRGQALRIQWRRHLQASGGSPPYDRLEITGVNALTRGTHTLLAGVNLGSSLSTELPVHDGFVLGGFLRLSGLPQHRLTGHHLALGRILFLERLSSGFTVVPAGSVRLGLSVEAGGVWTEATEVNLHDLSYAGSLLLGVDTMLGPLHLAYGRAETGESAWYFFLGRTF